MVQAVNLTGRDFAAKPEFFDGLGRHDIFKMMVVGFPQRLGVRFLPSRQSGCCAFI